jgi:hypothetical protein
MENNKMYKEYTLEEKVEYLQYKVDHDDEKRKAKEDRAMGLGWSE